MIALIPVIDELYKEFSQKIPLQLEQQENLEKKLRLEFNFNSNHIEGNTLTYAETEILLNSDETVGSHTLRELIEMKASDRAFKLVKYEASLEGSTLSEKFIKELNELLLVEPYWKEVRNSTGDITNKQIIIGQYKKDANYVRLENGNIHNYETPFETPIKMKELVEWVNDIETKKSLHPVEIAARLHYELVKIHPFDDGNGRVARLLMNYILIKHNYPPVVIKSDDKKNYLRAIRAADAGLYDSFIEYIAQQQIWSLKLGIKASNGENLNEEEDWKKRVQIIKRDVSTRDSVKIVKSGKVMEDLINKKLPEALFKTLEGLEVFSDLFLNRSFFITNPNTGATGNIQNLKLSADTINKQFTSKINVVIRFAEFTKNPDNPFTTEAIFQMVFSKYKYDVFYSDNIILKKLYHQDFTEEEISKLINLAGDRITSLIEDQINQE